MNIISTILIIFVALEFFYIMYLETIATTSKKTSETFNINVDKLKDKNINLLLKNQGVQTRHISSIGTHINALVSIGVWGFGDVVGGLEDLSELCVDFRLRVFHPNYFKQR